MGHRQLDFFKANWKMRYVHGGVLRQKKSGRGPRPLSTKDPLHIVFKCHRQHLREGSLRGAKSFTIVKLIIKKYSVKFFVKIEQISIQGDHIHLLVRCGRRSKYHSFFRVCAGQIAQVFQREGLLRKPIQAEKVNSKKTMTDTPIDITPPRLWMYRPFSRIVKSWKGFKIVREYILLNEKEALGQIRYQKQRLRGLSAGDWQILYSSVFLGFSNTKKPKVIWAFLS